MRNVLDIWKNLVVGAPTEEMEDMEEMEVEYEKSPSPSRRSALDEYEARTARRTYDMHPNNKIVSIGPEMTDMKVVVLSPLDYNDARQVCECLKSYSPVIVKLERLGREEAQRVVDFISGACYTMDGNVKSIREDIFLITPSIVPIETKGEPIPSDTKSPSSPTFFTRFATR